MTKDNINDSDLERAAHDLSKDDREAFSRQLEDLEKDFKNMKRWSDGHIAPRLRELAGSQLEGMLANQEETLKYLTDPNPKLRQAALQLAYRHWEITYTLANVYEKMARTDLDDEVRETAMRALGTCYAHTKDPRIGHLLAAIVRNEGFTLGTRVTAFAALLRLHGILDYAGKSPSVPLKLGDIDWTFVEEYYSGWKTDAS